MKLTHLALLAATSLAALPALAQDAAPAKTVAAPSQDYTIIKLNNQDIKDSEVIDTWKGLFPNGNAPDFNSFDENIRQNVLRGIVSEKLIYGEAEKAGVEKQPEVQKRIATMTRQIVMQSFIEEKAKTLITDDQLRAAYNAKVATLKGQEEIKARHILVPTEEEAKKISDQLKKGADFDKIAKEKSTDKASGVKGGELGWFTKDKMVPAFADAAFKLKKGEISPPVKSDFGWHVIQVEDRRPVTPPSFEESKEALKGELANKAVQNYVESLLKGADIHYYDASGKEKPFPRELLPAKPGEKGIAPAADKQ